MPQFRLYHTTEVFERCLGLKHGEFLPHLLEPHNDRIYHKKLRISGWVCRYGMILVVLHAPLGR